MRRAIDCLRGSADLRDLAPAALEVLAAGAVHFSLPAGDLLFESGSMPDGVYLVASGRLGVRMGGSGRWMAEIERGEWVGESGWLLKEPRSASVVALARHRTVAAAGRRARCRGGRIEPVLSRDRAAMRTAPPAQQHQSPRKRARVFALVPNSDEIDVLEFATQLVGELERCGRVELVWDVRATTHTSAWFSRIEELNDYVIYVADPTESGWTRQCCRQADVILGVARARAQPRAWPSSVTGAATGRGARIELALLHEGDFCRRRRKPTGSGILPATLHHHVIDSADMGRVVRLLTRRGVGLVLSGGGARGFAHLGVIRALREARVPLDFVGGASIGAIIAAGVAMDWSDEEMRLRYRRSFVDTNPVNDYTFPLVALTRGRKVSRLLQREFGDVLIEDLRQPFFCVSANLTTGRLLEHRDGLLCSALRAAVAIPGVMPPVFRGEEVLVDGAAINNLPVDIMQRHAPGLVIGSDAGADYSFSAGTRLRRDGPPLWKFFARSRSGKQRINIFQILMHAGMVNSVSGAAAQRDPGRCHAEAAACEHRPARLARFRSGNRGRL